MFSTLCCIGSVELAAVGVSVSVLVFNPVLKLFNVPLLNVTTSFVAEEQALIVKSNSKSQQIGQGTTCNISCCDYPFFFLHFSRIYFWDWLLCLSKEGFGCTTVC